MKIRSNYVSNSSSSSFIVGSDTWEFGVPCIKLSKEIVGLLNKHGANDDGKFDFDLGKDWYLTEFVSDSLDVYDTVSKIDGIRYMDGGHGGPYGDDDEYIIFNRCGDSFYLWRFDVCDVDGSMPSGVELAKMVKDTLRSKMKMGDKLKCIEEQVRIFEIDG